MNRQEFKPAVQAQIRARSGGRCECNRMPPALLHFFPKECDRPAAEIDHIYPDALKFDGEKLKPLTADDGAHLCKPCHAIKTASDRQMMAKRSAHTVKKERADKRRAKGKTAKIPGRGFQTNKDGPYKSKINGKTERRK